MYEAYLKGAPSRKILAVGPLVVKTAEGFLDTKETCVKPFFFAKTANIIYYTYLEMTNRDRPFFAWTNTFGMLEGMSRIFATLVRATDNKEIASFSLFYFFPGLIDLFFHFSDQFRDRFHPLEEFEPTFPVKKDQDSQNFFGSAFLSNPPQTHECLFHEITQKILRSPEKLDFLAFRKDIFGLTDPFTTARLVHFKARFICTTGGRFFVSLEVVSMEVQDLEASNFLAPPADLLQKIPSALPTSRLSRKQRRKSICKQNIDVKRDFDGVCSNPRKQISDFPQNTKVLTDQQDVSGRRPDILRRPPANEDRTTNSVKEKIDDKMRRPQKKMARPNDLRLISEDDNDLSFPADSPNQIGDPRPTSRAFTGLKLDFIQGIGSEGSNPVVSNHAQKDMARAQSSLTTMDHLTRSEKMDNYFEIVEEKLNQHRNTCWSLALILIIPIAYFLFLAVAGSLLFKKWFLDLALLNSKGYYFLNLSEIAVQQILSTRILSMAPADTLTASLMRQSTIINRDIVSTFHSAYQSDIASEGTVFQAIIENFVTYEYFNLEQSITNDRLFFNKCTEYAATLDLPALFSRYDKLTVPDQPMIPTWPILAWYVATTAVALVLFVLHVVSKFR
jgi:hypothetical protein